MKPEIIWSSQFQFLFSPLHFLSDLGPINVFLSVQPTFSHVDCEDTVSNPYSNPVLDSLKNGAQMGSISPSPDGTFQVVWISVPRILSQHIWWVSEETVINRYIYLQVNTILSIIWHIIYGTLNAGYPQK